MENWQEIALLAGIVVVVVAVAIVVAVRRNKPAKTKTPGRDYMMGNVVGHAKRWARSNGFTCIAPAHLARAGMTADLDAVVVGYFGVLGIKSLGYGGEVYGGPAEKEWLQVDGAGQRHHFPNPITQAGSDVRVIRDALFALKQKTVPVEVVCVFPNPKAQLALPRNTGHYTMKAFKDLLRKEKYTQDTGLDVQAVAGAIQGAVQE